MDGQEVHGLLGSNILQHVPEYRQLLGDSHNNEFEHLIWRSSVLVLAYSKCILAVTGPSFGQDALFKPFASPLPSNLLAMQGLVDTKGLFRSWTWEVLMCGSCQEQQWVLWEEQQKKTRQSLMQSVGNMPLLPLRHLLPHVLQIMPRNSEMVTFSQRGTIMRKIHRAWPKWPGTPNLTHFTKWKQHKN